MGAKRTVCLSPTFDLTASACAEQAAPLILGGDFISETFADFLFLSSTFVSKWNRSTQILDHWFRCLDKSFSTQYESISLVVSVCTDLCTQSEPRPSRISPVSCSALSREGLQLVPERRRPRPGLVRVPLRRRLDRRALPHPRSVPATSRPQAGCTL